MPSLSRKGTLASQGNVLISCFIYIENKSRVPGFTCKTIHLVRLNESLLTYSFSLGGDFLDVLQLKHLFLVRKTKKQQLHTTIYIFMYEQVREGAKMP